MSKVFRPKRGTKSKAISQLIGSNILKQGEIFFEIPDSGEGTNGNYGIKMGDGKSGYSNLPYILGPNETISYTLQGTGTPYNDTNTTVATTVDRINTIITNNGKSGNSISTIIGSICNAILSCAGGLSKLDTECSKIGANKRLSIQWIEISGVAYLAFYIDGVLVVRFPQGYIK